jgi:hypothetical protein
LGISQGRPADRTAGDDAMMVATQLVAMAVKRRENERALLMLRIRLAVAKLQEPPQGLLY